MKVTVSSLNLQGSLLGSENPLPVFMSKNRQLSLKDSGLLPEEKDGFRYETGFRVLPYLMQDNYNRDKKTIELKTIILENDILRATFLPEYGARLYSLLDKKHSKELLHVNPVFQPANLAIRNAWVSGGIEWNIGHFGHTFLTMEDYFAVICKDEDGNEFLRFYEYERCKRVFIQMDFHLYPSVAQLIAHIRIENTRNENIPMYWWTNIAIPESGDVRIFSGSKGVILTQPESTDIGDKTCGFTHGSMPYLKPLGGLDASYPKNFLYSNEYFFQNPKRLDCTWEAACYDDGSVFFERSTSTLTYRKMFCWGMHKGGKRWKEFLSSKDTGDYVEIQAGLSRTQVHGFDMGALSTISFTQVFGGTKSTGEQFQGDWEDTSRLVYNLIEDQIPEKNLTEFDARCAINANTCFDNFVHFGSGWWALEAELDSNKIPHQLLFPYDTIGADQEPWLNLLKNGFLLENPKQYWPISYMTDPVWIDLLENSKSSTSAERSLVLVLIGIGLWENGKFDEAFVSMQNALYQNESPFALRCMSMLLRAKGDYETAMLFMQKSIESFAGIIPHRAFAEEYIQLLIENDEHEKAWHFYESLHEDFKNEERIVISLAPAALILDKRDFLIQQFKKEFAVIREGESGFVEIYKEIMTRIHEETSGFQFDHVLRKKFKETIDIPENLDFRTH